MKPALERKLFSPIFEKGICRKVPFFAMRKSYVGNYMAMKELAHLAYFKMWYLFQNNIFKEFIVSKLFI